MENQIFNDSMEQRSTLYLGDKEFYNEDLESLENYQNEVAEVQKAFAVEIKKADRDKDKKVALFLKLKSALPSIDLNEFCELLCKTSDRFETFENRDIAAKIESDFNCIEEGLKKKNNFITIAVSAITAGAKFYINKGAKMKADYKNHAEQRLQELKVLLEMGYKFSGGAGAKSLLTDPFNEVVQGVTVTNGNNYYGVLVPTKYNQVAATSHLKFKFPSVKTIARAVLAIPLTDKMATKIGNVITSAKTKDFDNETPFESVTNEYLRKIEIKGNEYNGIMKAVDDLLKEKVTVDTNVKYYESAPRSAGNDATLKSAKDKQKSIDSDIKMLVDRAKTFEKVAKIVDKNLLSAEIEAKVKANNPVLAMTPKTTTSTTSTQPTTAPTQQIATLQTASIFSGKNIVIIVILILLSLWYVKK